MFVEDTDYSTLVDARGLQILSQTSQQNRDRAEDMAMEEISSYLADRYNMPLSFSKQGSDRNPLLLMYVIDIAIYNMMSWLPQKMGYEIRKERYENAIKWLNNAAKGITNPDLPAKGDDGSGTYDPAADESSPIQWGCEKRNNSVYKNTVSCLPTRFSG